MTPEELFWWRLGLFFECCRRVFWLRLYSAFLDARILFLQLSNALLKLCHSLVVLRYFLIVRRLKILNACLLIRNLLIERWHRFLNKDPILLKHRIGYRPGFLASCCHRPPPVVGPPSNVNASDRHA